MTCGALRDLTSAYVEGEVTAEERVRIDAHTASCRACHARIDDVTRVVSAVHAVRPVRVPANFADAVMARVSHVNARGEEPTPLFARWSWSLPALRVPGYVWAPALAAAAILLVVFIPRGGQEQPNRPTASIATSTADLPSATERVAAPPTEVVSTAHSPRTSIRRTARADSGAPPAPAGTITVATENPIVDTQAVGTEGFLLSGTRMDGAAAETEWVLDEVNVESTGLVQRASTSSTAFSRPLRKRSLTF